jgi:hypothetical protein
MATNRLLLGVRGERSPPCGKTDGGQPRSPRLPFALFVFFTLVSSFGLSYVLATLIAPPRSVPFVSSPVYPLQDIGAVEHAGKGNEGAIRSTARS